VIAAALALSGCLSPSPPFPSGQTPAPSSQDGSSFIMACQPIDLRGPSGQRVDLTGAWMTAPGTAGFFYLLSETTWIHQIDDCVWGAILDEEFHSYPARGGDLGTLQGHVTPDFALEGDMVLLVDEWGRPGPRVPIRFLIEWQADGRIQLHEDRDPSGAGPRCFGGTVYCPAVILYRVEDDPLAELRSARDAICRPLHDQVEAVAALLVDYDVDPPQEPSARAELLDQIAAIVRVELAQLSAITLPESIAAEFAADLERREAELAELEAEAKALRSGDLAEAARLDLSILPVNQAMRQFQAAHRFADCP
jgi:hypothetical protein